MKSIIELAREAGFSVKNFKPPVITAQHSNGSWIGIDDELERFAALVRAAALDEAAGIAKRRLLADGSDKEKQAHWTACQNISAAIQQLKETK